MLQGFPIHATLAVTDIDRARQWYAEKLGMEPTTEDMGGLWYRFAGDTWLHLYATPTAGTAKNTVAGWAVSGIEAVMAGLRARGVVFEEYDFGEMRTVDGLLEMGGAKACWLTDSEGNILEISEVPAGS